MPSGVKISSDKVIRYKSVYGVYNLLLELCILRTIFEEMTSSYLNMSIECSQQIYSSILCNLEYPFTYSA